MDLYCVEVLAGRISIDEEKYPGRVKSRRPERIETMETLFDRSNSSYTATRPCKQRSIARELLYMYSFNPRKVGGHVMKRQ